MPIVALPWFVSLAVAALGAIGSDCKRKCKHSK